MTVISAYFGQSSHHNTHIRSWTNINRFCFISDLDYKQICNLIISMACLMLIQSVLKEGFSSHDITTRTVQNMHYLSISSTYSRNALLKGNSLHRNSLFFITHYLPTLMLIQTNLLPFMKNREFPTIPTQLFPKQKMQTLFKCKKWVSFASDAVEVNY